MMQRKLLFFALAILLICVEIVAAQSSANYVTHRFVMGSGSSADSAHFTVTSLFGQPATDVVSSPNYKVSGGFLHPLAQISNYDVWLPVIVK